MNGEQPREDGRASDGGAEPVSRVGRLIVIVAILALLAIVIVAVVVVIVGGVSGNHAGPAGPLTDSTRVSPSSGSVVFSDDFHDASSGWTTQTLPSGTTFAYTETGYVVVAKGSLEHFATSPSTQPVQQIAISLTAVQSNDAPIGAGFGVSCWRGTDKSELRYDFEVTKGGSWQVDRRDGGVSTKAKILKQGHSSVTLGSTPVRVLGMCATLADLHTTRLVLFVGAGKLADFTDSAAATPDAGWLADLVVISQASHTSTVTVTRFEVRDLAG